MGTANSTLSQDARDAITRINAFSGTRMADEYERLRNAPRAAVDAFLLGLTREQVEYIKSLDDDLAILATEIAASGNEKYGAVRLTRDDLNLLTNTGQHVRAFLIWFADAIKNMSGMPEELKRRLSLVDEISNLSHRLVHVWDSDKAAYGTSERVRISYRDRISNSFQILENILENIRNFREIFEGHHPEYRVFRLVSGVFTTGSIRSVGRAVRWAPASQYAQPLYLDKTFNKIEEFRLFLENNAEYFTQQQRDMVLQARLAIDDLYRWIQHHDLPTGQ